jgi:prepilin-type N-terminal cleavage/methylation domain-containing protein
LNRRPRAFTLIELLVVIGIIAILATLLIVGIEHLQTTAKKQTTLQILASAQAMFGEYDAAVRPPRNTQVTPCPQNVTNDYYLGVTGGGTIPAQASTATPPADRYSAVAVITTRGFLVKLRAMPVNAAAMAKMPEDEKLTIPSNVTTTVTNTWTVGNNYTAYSTADGVGEVLYNGSPYICIQSNTASTTPDTTPTNGNYWVPIVTDTSIPLLADAWGNPIIYVPYRLGTGNALNADGTIPAAQGILKVGGITFTQQSPDGRPFFASAGPDGDFSKGDDNIYSFEK